MLASWVSNGPTRAHALTHTVNLCAISIAILTKLDFIGRTSESARLYGIDFVSVLTRGSQYRVEAVLLRVAKPMGKVFNIMM